MLIIYQYSLLKALMQEVQKKITAQLGLSEKLQMLGLPDRWQHIMLGMMHAPL